MEMLRMEVLMVLSCHFLRNQFRVFTILPGDQSRNAVVMFDRVTNIFFVIKSLSMTNTLLMKPYKAINKGRKNCLSYHS
jgi:hypothetical protein